jgi:hypothetical protein
MCSQKGRGDSSIHRAPEHCGRSVHRHILRYTYINENETRLGMFIEVYARNTILTFSQITI